MSRHAVVQKILVRLPTWVGDVVMATPALRALRHKYSEARIGVMGGQHLESLLGGGDLYDDYLPLAKGAGSTSKNIQSCADYGADIAVILPHSFRAAWECWRAGVPQRLGYAREGRGLLLTHSLTPHQRMESRSRSQRWAGVWDDLVVKLSKRWALRQAIAKPERLRLRREAESILPVPMILQYLELVSVLGAVEDGQGPLLPVPSALAECSAEHLARLGLARDEPYIAVNPGASFGVSKVYPLDLLATALDELNRQSGWPILILCGPGEEALARDLESRMTSPAINSAVEMLALDRVKFAIGQAKLLVTTDTGPWHIANALGCPSVVLMGPTDPRYTASHLEQSIVLRKEVPCGPCHLKQCPFDHHRCMREILPEEVVKAAMELLEVS